MSDIAISVQDLWKQYRLGQAKSTSFRESVGQWFSKSEVDYFWALRELNFEVKKGEAIGIIGKNGAGKSTLLKVLSKITYPTKGRIEINGRVSSLLEVGTGFHPELSGRQNVYLNGTILGMTRKEIDSKFDEIIAFSGVEKFIDTAVKHYSSGMKVRLAFSVAAHLEPEILIIDEVLAVGDAEFQKKCLGKMEDVTGQGRTVLFVSHNMNAISQLCNRIHVIQDGKTSFDSRDVSAGIGFYLNQGLDTDSSKHQIKQEISNPIHTISEISLTDKEENILDGNIHASNEIILKIEGEILNEDPAFNLGLILYNQRQEEICSSWLKTEITSKTHVSGEFKFEIEFYPYFFNENDYTIEIVSVLHNVKNLIKKGEGPRLNFHVVDGLSKSMINPKLEWTIK
ncbi:MAG: lipopolysaccharide transport system ATP-binding protein [Cyclobacteriaceae bacterium]|jgi:lipopolysaccharide transport system ATP-binding protein